MQGAKTNRASCSEHCDHSKAFTNKVDRPSEAELARAADLSAPATPTRPEQRFRPPHRSRGSEQARAANLSAPARPSGPEQRFRPPQRSRAGWSGHFERPSEAERARAANSSAPARPSRLEQQFRQPQQSRAGSANSSAPAKPSGQMIPKATKARPACAKRSSTQIQIAKSEFGVSKFVSQNLESESQCSFR